MKRMLQVRSTLTLSSLLVLLGATACGASSAGSGPEAKAVGSGQAPVAAAGPADGEPPCEHGDEGGHGHHKGRFFERLDKDGDGKVAVAELPEPMKEHLAQADANGDGVLTREELKAAHEKHHEEMKKRADTNGDGQISKEEWQAARSKFAEERFAKGDKNGDGFLTEEEIGAQRWKFIAPADANKDGKISKDEISTAMQNGTLKPPHHGGHHGEGGPDEGGPHHHHEGHRGDAG